MTETTHKTFMAEAEYENVSQSENEKQIVQELRKLTIYREQTTLDGIIEEAKKNLNETKTRLKELRTLFGDEQDQGKLYNLETFCKKEH